MWAKVKKLFRRREEEEGQGPVEYGLILGLIGVVAIAALNAPSTTTGTNVNSMLQRVSATVGAAGAESTPVTATHK